MSHQLRAVAAALVLLGALCGTAAAGEAQNALPEPRSTETMRAEVFGDQEAAADAWVQLNAFVNYARWDDAALAAQQLVALRPTVLIQDLNDKALYVPAPSRVQEFMAKHAELREAYRRAYEAEAEILLTEFERDRDFASARRLLEQFPFTLQRGKALRLAADGYLDRLEYESACTLLGELQATQQAADQQERLAWACKEAWALTAAGRLDEAAGKIADLRERFAGAAVPGCGMPLEIGQFCWQLEDRISKARSTSGVGFSLERLGSAQGWSVPFSHPAPLVSHVAATAAHRPTFGPVVSGGTVYVTNGNELRAVEAAGGREIWTWQPPRPGRFNVSSPDLWLESLGPTSLRPAVTQDHILFLRPINLAEVVYSVCCLQRATGWRLWQRVAWSEEHENPETGPVAFGDRAVVVAAKLLRPEGGHPLVQERAVVCFRIETGELIWRVALPPPAPPTERDLPGSVAGPFVGDSSILVLEDRGAAYCLDRGTGAIRWARTLDTAVGKPAARPGGGLCSVAGDRVCLIAVGSSRVECVELRGGGPLWSRALDSPAQWLATDGERVLVASPRLQALSPSDGSVAWSGDLSEAAVGPPCPAGSFVLLPTEKSMNAYEAKSGRLAARLEWPNAVTMTDLAVSGSDVIGLAGDAICKFGETGTEAVRRPGAAVEANLRDLSPEGTAAILFANARLEDTAAGASKLATVGQPLGEAVSAWVVYDAAARQLRCLSGNDSIRPRWEVPFAGNVRAIAFDETAVYVWCADRLEVRSVSGGELLVTKSPPPLAPPRYDQGRVLWVYEKAERGTKEERLAGWDVGARRGFDAAVGQLGYRRLLAYHWEGDRVFLLGESNEGKRVYRWAEVAGDTLNVSGGPVEADEIVRSIDFGNTVWLAAGRRMFVFVPDKQTLCCYSLESGRRLWVSQLESNSRPMVQLQQCGRHLLWRRQLPNGGGEPYYGVTEMETGRTVRRVNADVAVLSGDRLYTLWGPYVRAYDVRSGRVLKEIRSSQSNRKASWIQPLGDRLVVALADQQNVIREALLADREMRDVAGLETARPPEARYTEVPIHREPMQIDGWLADWDRVRMPYQPIDSWRPDPAGRGQRPSSDRSAGDLIAGWRACLTEETLYLVVVVHDDQIEPSLRGDCPWIGDSIEVALAGESLARRLPTFHLAPGGPGSCWASCPRPLPANLCAVRYDPVERVIIYEMAFPFSWLREIGIKPRTHPQRPELVELAMALVVNDVDESRFEGSLEWGEGLANSWNPSAWRVLRYRIER